MDLRQTEEYAKYLSSVGWIVEKDKKTKTNIYIKKIPLLGLSILKLQRPERLPQINSLREIIKKHRVIQSNIETVNNSDILTLVKNGYKRNKAPFLPGTTILIDLSFSKKALLSLMKAKSRYNIGLSKKRGVVVKVVNGNKLTKDDDLFESLFYMQRQNAKRLGIFLLPKKWFKTQINSFGNKCFAAMAYIEDELVAATFYMTSDEGVFYSHNGSTLKGRQNYAPTACVWKGMLEGKRRGLRVFDFEGIYDPRSKIKRWKGFTRFKEGFGGRKVMHPNLYSKWHFFK